MWKSVFVLKKRNKKVIYAVDMARYSSILSNIEQVPGFAENTCERYVEIIDSTKPGKTPVIKAFGNMSRLWMFPTMEMHPQIGVQ